MTMNVDFFNSLWKINPCILFDSKNTPMITTYQIHNNGTKKHLHVPRQPYHNLSSIYGDQLAPCAI